MVWLQEAPEVTQYVYQREVSRTEGWAGRTCCGGGQNGACDINPPFGGEQHHRFCKGNSSISLDSEPPQSLVSEGTDAR